MKKSVLAIVGSYRKGGVIDQTIDVILNTASERGAEVEKIYLADHRIEFCIKCHEYAQHDSEHKQGNCGHKDDMPALFDKLAAADAVVLGSSVNFGTVTAQMKRFIERLMVYAYWPWRKQIPVMRPSKKYRSAVVISSGACPAFLGRFFLSYTRKILRTAAYIIGCKVVSSLYFGAVTIERGYRLSASQVKSVRKAAVKLLK
ncbi:MAG: flavodoxin family protein [Candidatus Auribacterota bacterium]